MCVHVVAKVVHASGFAFMINSFPFYVQNNFLSNVL